MNWCSDNCLELEVRYDAPETTDDYSVNHHCDTFESVNFLNNSVTALKINLSNNMIKHYNSLKEKASEVVGLKRLAIINLVDGMILIAVIGAK